jgi:hypothetical protein
MSENLYKTIKSILQIVVVYFVLFYLKLKVRWIYFPVLWHFVILFAMFPATFTYLLFNDETTLGSIYNLPKLLYAIYIVYTIIIFKIVDGAINYGLKLSGEEARAKNNWKDHLIGLPIAIAFFILFLKNLE